MPDPTSLNSISRLNAPRRSRSQLHRKKRSRRLNLQNLEDRSVPAVALAHVNDNWHFLADNDASNSLTVGDTVRNDLDTIASGTLTATYGVDGFGTVTSGAFTGSLAGSATISNAIANTNVGGTVNVLEGVYGEFSTVNKTLTIRGRRPAWTHGPAERRRRIGHSTERHWPGRLPPQRRRHRHQRLRHSEQHERLLPGVRGAFRDWQVGRAGPEQHHPEQHHRDQPGQYRREPGPDSVQPDSEQQSARPGQRPRDLHRPVQRRRHAVKRPDRQQ